MIQLVLNIYSDQIRLISNTQTRRKKSSSAQMKMFHVAQDGLVAGRYAETVAIRLPKKAF